MEQNEIAHRRVTIDDVLHYESGPELFLAAPCPALVGGFDMRHLMPNLRANLYS